MSRADTRAGTILAMVVASASLLGKHFETRAIALSVQGLATDAANAMFIFVPEEEQLSCRLIEQNLIRFAAISGEREMCNTSVLGYLATQLLDDLLLLVKNKEKRDILEKCYWWADQIIEVSDPDDMAIDCRRAAERSIADLYKVVGLA